MDIQIEDPSKQDIVALLEEHLRDMYANSPACSVHALDVERLRQPEITFWTARENGRLVGCGALKQLDERHGELKSMRTTPQARHRGVARSLLAHVLDAARARGMTRISLETGSQAFFQPARALYTRHGFEICGPFGDYQPDPNSVFMTRSLP